MRYITINHNSRHFIVHDISVIGAGTGDHPSVVSLFVVCAKSLKSPLTQAPPLLGAVFEPVAPKAQCIIILTMPFAQVKSFVSQYCF